MGVTLNQNTDCCKTSCTNSTVNVAGPAGAAGATGAAGTNGTDGANAYTNTTSAATIPAALSAVTLPVNNASPFVTGQVVYVQNAGYFEVVSTAALSLTLKNLADGTHYTGNAVSGSLADGSKITPSGTQGLDGSAGITYPAGFVGKGDLLTHNGTAYSDLAIGSADTQSLFTDSTAPNGMAWRRPLFTDLDHASAPLALDTVTLSGQLPLAKLGGGAAAGQMAYWDGSNWVAVAVGGDGYLLTYNLSSNEPEWRAKGDSISVLAQGVADIDYSASSGSLTGVTIKDGAVNCNSGQSNYDQGSKILTINFLESIGTGAAYPVALISPSKGYGSGTLATDHAMFVDELSTTGGTNSAGVLTVDCTTGGSGDFGIHFTILG